MMELYSEGRGEGRKERKTTATKRPLFLSIFLLGRLSLSLWAMEFGEHHGDLGDGSVGIHLEGSSNIRKNRQVSSACFSLLFEEDEQVIREISCFSSSCSSSPFCIPAVNARNAFRL